MLGLIWVCLAVYAKRIFWNSVPEFTILVPSDYSQCSSAAPGAGWSLSTLDTAFPNLILNPVGSHTLALGDGPVFLGLGIPDIQHSFGFSRMEKRSQVGNMSGCQLCQE